MKCNHCTEEHETEFYACSKRTLKINKGIETKNLLDAPAFNKNIINAKNSNPFVNKIEKTIKLAK